MIRILIHLWSQIPSQAPDPSIGSETRAKALATRVILFPSPTTKIRESTTWTLDEMVRKLENQEWEQASKPGSPMSVVWPDSLTLDATQSEGKLQSATDDAHSEMNEFEKLMNLTLNIAPLSQIHRVIRQLVRDGHEMVIHLSEPKDWYYAIFARYLLWMAQRWNPVHHPKIKISAPKTNDSVLHDMEFKETRHLHASTVHNFFNDFLLQTPVLKQLGVVDTLNFKRRLKPDIFLDDEILNIGLQLLEQTYAHQQPFCLSSLVTVPEFTQDTDQSREKFRKMVQKKWKMATKTGPGQKGIQFLVILFHVKERDHWMGYVIHDPLGSVIEIYVVDSLPSLVERDSLDQRTLWILDRVREVVRDTVPITKPETKSPKTWKLVSTRQVELVKFSCGDHFLFNVEQILSDPMYPSLPALAYEALNSLPTRSWTSTRFMVWGLYVYGVLSDHDLAVFYRS